MSERVEELLELLTSRDNPQAYRALRALEEISAESNCLYPHMDKLIAMMGSSNSYARARTHAYGPQCEVGHRSQNRQGNRRVPGACDR